MTAAHDRLLTLLDETPVLIGLCDAALANFEFINRSGRELIGLGLECDAPNPAFCDIFTDVEGGVLSPRPAPSSSWTGEARLATCEGTTRPVSLSVTPHSHPGGTIDYFAIVARDSSTEWQAANALRESEAMLRSVLENVVDSICVIDATGRPVWSNPSFNRLMSAVGSLRKPEFCTDLVHPDDRATALAALAQARNEGQSESFRFRLAISDGSTRLLEANVSRIKEDKARPLRLIAIARDITDRP